MDLLSVGRSHAHQELVTKTEFDLICESTLLIILSLATVFINEDIDYTRCTLHPRKHLTHFIMFIFWPSLLLRLLIYLKFRNVSYSAMYSFILILNIY